MVIDVFEKGSRSKLALAEAEQLAQKHQYIEACNIAGGIIDDWYSSGSNLEHLYRDLWMDELLLKVRRYLAEWEPLALREYNAAKERSQWLATEGRFEEAIAIFEPVHKQYYQPEGKELLKKFYQLLQGKYSFYLGILAEKAENFHAAQQHYQNAIAASPEWKQECQIRLSIIAIKKEKWTDAIEYLEKIHTEQASYIRGFAYAKLENWQKAQYQWQNVSHPAVKNLGEQDKRPLLNAKREIQQLVDRGNLQEAELVSQKFLEEFGDDQLVRENLNKNIIPRLDINLWRQQKWEQIAQTAEQRWLRHWDITTLHNWALACYYQAFTDPSANNLANLIIASSTAIANLHQNPLLQNPPWLGDTPVDLNEISSSLRKRLESLLEQVDKNSDSYDQLQELYRLEVEALNLMGTPPTTGLRVKGLFITPGCYHRYRQKLNVYLRGGKPLWALYTDWWQPVLACMQGDTYTAIQIKPKDEPTSEVEEYAQKLIAYYEGCYYLEIIPGGYPRWRFAMTPLKFAQREIRKNLQWLDNIEELCQKHYQAISWNQSDRLEFAQFWYDLIDSPTAKSYLE